MVAADTLLYLPLSDRMLDSVLKDAEGFTALPKLSAVEVAALTFLQHLPSLRGVAAPPLERLFAETLEIAKKDGPAAFVAMLDLAKIREGRQLLPDFRIELVDEEALARKSYLTPEGRWNWTFGERQRERFSESCERVELPGGVHQMLTAEQSRIYREVRAQTDDHLHVQGYAGTGKSRLVSVLLSLLAPTGATALVLAERQQQLQALLAGIDRSERVHAKTFGELASSLIPQDLTRPADRRMRQGKSSGTPISDDDIVRHLGIWTGGRFPAQLIVSVVRATVMAFCRSGDTEFMTRHVPNWATRAFDSETKQLVLHYSAELWSATHSPPSRDFRPPVRDYHRIKWAALHQVLIPAHYTHVLIDECHDLTKPMMQILQASPQAVITLGDEYQNLQGMAQERPQIIRQREVTCSVRSGEPVELIINPIIAVHPGRTKLPFHGNALNTMEIEYYDKARIPERPAVILVNSSWELFEWAQRLASEDRDFAVLSNVNQLNMFAHDCIDLKMHATRPRHGALFRFASWGEVINDPDASRSVHLIDRMLEGGYDHNHWRKTCTRIVDGGARGYALGRIEDVRNREFPSVMLAPEVVDSAFDIKRTPVAPVCSAIYVAVTRAQHRLIVPERLRNWIEEISAKKSFRT